MENTNLDKITSIIMANSSLEITNPYFSKIIMTKKIQKEKQRPVVRYILFCSLFIIVACVVIILLLKPGQSAGLVLPSQFDIFSSSIIINIAGAGNWIMKDLYFILPVVVLLLFKKLIDSKLKHL